MSSSMPSSTDVPLKRYDCHRDVRGTRRGDLAGLLRCPPNRASRNDGLEPTGGWYYLMCHLRLSGSGRVRFSGWLAGIALLFSLVAGLTGSLFAQPPAPDLKSNPAPTAATINPTL